MLKHILILLTVLVNPLLSMPQNALTVNDKEEYEKLLKLYEDSLEAYEGDKESLQGADHFLERGL